MGVRYFDVVVVVGEPGLLGRVVRMYFGVARSKFFFLSFFALCWTCLTRQSTYESSRGNNNQNFVES